MKEPKVLTYEEWLAEYYPDWEDEENGDCPDCGGTGKVECYTCGEETLECEACEGSGVLEAKDSHKPEYLADKRSDLENWKRWQGIKE